MKKNIKQIVAKRMASIAMSALLAVSGVGLFPQFAMPVQAADYTFNISDNYVYGDYDHDCTVEITGTSTTNSVYISVDSGNTVMITLNNVNIDVSSIYNACALEISGAGNVVINLEGTNILESGEERAGLEKNDTGTLTITGTGSLNAIGGDYGAGIGGRNFGSASNIEITSGTVTAVGGGYGAGIGGGHGGSGSNIEIIGGEVTATGGIWAAGIGGGDGASCSNIDIFGGTVKATGGSRGAGIGGGGSGGGTDGNGTDISISGGTVYAIGGDSGAGIGGGLANGPGGTAYGIIISGSSIVYVAGGADYDAPNSSWHYGAGASIGSGGHQNNVSGDELTPDTTGLTTGRIVYFPAGTSMAAIIAATGSAPASAPVDYMKEVEDAINAAIALGGPQTVYIKGYSALSYHVLEMLQQHPDITLVSEFSFDGLDYKITIPGYAVKLNPDIDWYGPKYLFPMFYMYGSDTAPTLQAYLDKYPET